MKRTSVNNQDYFAAPTKTFLTLMLTCFYFSGLMICSAVKQPKYVMLRVQHVTCVVCCTETCKTKKLIPGNSFRGTLQVCLHGSKCGLAL